MAAAMDTAETQLEQPVEEATALVEEQLGTCNKCKLELPQRLLLQKSKHSWLCRPCNRLSVFTSGLQLPEEFSSLPADQVVEFYRDVKKYTDERTGRLVHEKVSTAVQMTVEKSTTKEKSSSVGGDFLPLSVQVMKGWDPELVKSAGEFLDHPTMGHCYKMPVISEHDHEKTSLKRKEITTVNLRARRGRKALKAADEAVEPPEDLDLLSEAEEEEDNGNETKQEKRDRLKKEAVKNKQLQKDFKKNTAAASKAVAELLPLLAKVTEEAKSSSKAPQLLQEAQTFLAQATVGATLSFEALHVTTEATLLKNSLAAAKPKRAARKAAAKKAEEQQTQG